MKRSGIIFIISGPSGSGKTTLLKKLIASRELQGKLIKSVSLTTRPQRPGEEEGEDYFFISKAEFKKRLAAKKILEWTRYLGYYYATPKDFLERNLGANTHRALCLDLRGAAKIKRLYPKNTVTIFVTPPSLATLKRRIANRRCKTKREEIAQRMQLAIRELCATKRYDYRILNKDLRLALKELKDIVFSKIKHQT